MYHFWIYWLLKKNKSLKYFFAITTVWNFLKDADELILLFDRKNFKDKQSSGLLCMGQSLFNF